MNAKKMGKLIQVLRKERGISQEEAAAEIGIGRSTLASIESGNDNAGIKSLVAIADFYGASLDVLTLRTSEANVSLSKDERDLLAAYRELPAHAKDGAVKLVEMAANLARPK